MLRPPAVARRPVALSIKHRSSPARRDRVYLQGQERGLGVPPKILRYTGVTPVPRLPNRSIFKFQVSAFCKGHVLDPSCRVYLQGQERGLGVPPKILRYTGVTPVPRLYSGSIFKFQVSALILLKRVTISTLIRLPREHSTEVAVSGWGSMLYFLRLRCQSAFLRRGPSDGTLVVCSTLPYK